MTFHNNNIKPQRVAIVGAGISGLASAYLLSPHHAVTIYEAEPRLGGHARTIVAGINGDQPVDTGFIVFNYANYPNLAQMFDDLEVPVRKSDMSFGTSIDEGRIEYGLRSLDALFAQRRNLSRPSFLRMVRDILRFNARAEQASKDQSATVDDLMGDLKLGRWFQDYYLTPLCGAIWSTPPDQIRAFPANALVQFFRNHALLNVYGQHQWWTVDGGSIEYVRRLETRLRGQGVAIRTGAPVERIVRTGSSSIVHAKNAPMQEFDHVILACHADQALRLLDRPTADEATALSGISFQDNTAVLHRDVAQMPRRKPVWSSWVYQADTSKQQSRIGVTYWMNKLQGIPTNDPHFVTLNPTRTIPDHLVYDETTFRHPVFDHAALRAQSQLNDMQGRNNTWFAGAYTRYGFHEDGFASAKAIAQTMQGQLV